MINLRRQRLLQNREEGVGLTAHGYGQGQVLHPVRDISGSQQFLT